VAAVLAGAESGGEPVALLACASLVEPLVPGLRRVAGGGGQESVCGPRRHRNDQDRLQSSIYLKGRMKLPESVSFGVNGNSKLTSLDDALKPSHSTIAPITWTIPKTTP